MQMQTSVAFSTKPLDASDAENSPRSTSAGSPSTQSRESTPRREVNAAEVCSPERDADFDALDAELANCNEEASLPVGGLKASRTGVPQVPDHSSYIVRNTFIDELFRPTSLEGFFSERKVCSCPATRTNTAENEDPLEGWLKEGRSPSIDEVFDTGSPRFWKGMSKLEEEDQDFQEKSLDYLQAICVRNSFINTIVSRSESLEAFFQERKVQSCPNTHRAMEPCTVPEQHNDGDVLKLADHVFGEGSTKTATLTAPTTCELRAAIPGGDMPLPADWNPQVFDFVQQMGSAAWPAFDVPAMTPCQAENSFGPGMIPPPPAEWAPSAFEFGVVKPPPLPTGELGSEEMPTVGSLLHSCGECQPCGFFHTKGCMNGARCAFCHLCQPGEVKRRRKEKRERFQKAREEALSAAQEAGESLDTTEIPSHDDLNTPRVSQ